MKFIFNAMNERTNLEKNPGIGLVEIGFRLQNI